MYSNSRNDVPRVAQRYGTIAAHTRRRASVLVVFVMFCVLMYSFAGLIRRTPPPTFSDTAITDRHSDTTISSSELSGCGYPGLLDRKNRSDMYRQWESNPRLPVCKGFSCLVSIHVLYVGTKLHAYRVIFNKILNVKMASDAKACFSSKVEYRAVIDLFHIVCAHAYIGHLARYFSIIGETLHRWGKRSLSH